MNSTKNDGGPAFPQTNDAWYGKENNPPCPSGMSLRDWFAGQALIGLCSQKPIPTTADLAAVLAYQVADAMLLERSKL